MNLYVRFFDQEVLVNSVEEAIAFLENIPEVGLKAAQKKQLIDFVNSSKTYPYRVKLKGQVYFLVIKTDAKSIEEFKQNAKKNSDDKQETQEAKEVNKHDAASIEERAKEAAAEIAIRRQQYANEVLADDDNNNEQMAQPINEEPNAVEPVVNEVIAQERSNNVKAALKLPSDFPYSDLISSGPKLIPSRMEILNEVNPGWYEGRLIFKRAIPRSDYAPFRYEDTQFIVQLKGKSGADCYTQMVNHLKNRQDIDARSQYPSMKGSNFAFKYLGENPVVY